MLEPVCTVSSLAADEPLIGSAPDARAWVCLEQPGPWGRKAFTSSHLDPVLGAEIERLAAAHGIRPSLVRRPGRHAVDAHLMAAPMVLVAHTDPADPWLLTGNLDSAADILELDWAAVAAGDAEAVIASLPTLTRAAEEQLLVCTNGTRDTCCALFGRLSVTPAAAAHPGRVWEVTHTSGHRFAPTTVMLPSGYLHGRVAASADLLTAATGGRLVLDGLRGRSTWTGAGQVAEEAVRRTEDITALHDLCVTAADDDWLVTHRDGRTWLVRVSTTVSGERAESCGKDLKPVTRYEARIL
ncbi:MAG: Sucraseferredoxin family protein [Marmoricola sp.]|jgi:hypothetical protein|nr:Sucraseferredoxin family protein [Marmoricola sp.]